MGRELLAGGASGFRRLRTIRPIPLPGGDAATKEILRSAEALRYEAGWKMRIQRCAKCSRGA